MSLPDAQLTQLRALLQACSAYVLGADGARGSGFFVDDQLLLTCAHVVQGGSGTKVEVTPRTGPARIATVLRWAPGEDQDLALVEVPTVPGEPARPAVVLDAAVSDAIQYYGVGFPVEKLLGTPGIEEIALQGHRRDPLDPSCSSLLMFDAGQGAIKSGLSGGAVLNTITGAVCALVQYTNDEIMAAGGAGIPIARAARAFDEIASRLSEPPLATRKWRDALGPVGWHALNKSWGWRRRLDVVVSGSSRCWRVGVQPDEANAQELTAGDLPRELSLALFYWAQLRLPTRRSEVELVGKLLASAVFPDLVASHFKRERQADDLLVRLRVDPDSGLFDVPWEFVTAPWDGETVPLSAGKTTNLVRVGSHRSPDEVVIAPAPGDAGLLGIVVQPEDYESLMPTYVSGQHVKWPVDAAEPLRSAADAAGLQVRLLEHPTPFELDDAVQGAGPTPIEVVHYIGFGKVDSEGPKMALLDDDGCPLFRPAAEVFEQVARSGARLFVAQFVTPPTGEDWEPIEPKTFLQALDGRVNAVVFNRVPIYAGRASWFNKELYKTLGRGETVETAVREARRRLYTTPPPEDEASFAWYTLITGDRSDMRLMPPEAAPASGAVRVDAPPVAPPSRLSPSRDVVRGGRDVLTG